MLHPHCLWWRLSSPQASKNEETHYVVPNDLPRQVAKDSVNDSVAYMCEGKCLMNPDESSIPSENFQLQRTVIEAGCHGSRATKRFKKCTRGNACPTLASGSWKVQAFVLGPIPRVLVYCGSGAQPVQANQRFAQQ